MIRQVCSQTLLILLLNVVFLFALSAADTASSPKTIKVLGIGNSFTINALTFIEAIDAADPDIDIIAGRATIGGCSMEKHVRLFKEHEQDATKGLHYNLNVKDEAGNTKRKKVSLKAMLQSDTWDVVTIQQLSRLSTIPASYQPYAKELYDYIKQHAPQAKIVLHQTWAYRVDGDFDKVWPDRKGYDQAAMYRDSSLAYDLAAQQLNVELIPVGAAFQLARERRPFVPVAFDEKALQKPQLPTQEHSLCVGYAWRKNALRNDSHHANVHGCLLAGLVWYNYLTAKKSGDLTLSIGNIPEEDIVFYQSIADDIATGVRPAIQPTAPAVTDE